jgi:purine nucleosidase
MKKFASPCSISRSPGTGRRVPSLRNALWMMVGVALAAEAAFASPREKVLFDTDIGGDPDDGLALVYLLKEPRCELLGVTTVGGRPERTARVASALCHSLGRGDVPIHAGSSHPILRGRDLEAIARKQAAWDEELRRWPHAEITNDHSAVEFMRRTIRANPGEVTLCAPGPFSNVAALFAVDPEIPSLLKRLVLMGANFREKQSEWNALADVLATAVVLEGGFRKPPKELVLASFDATSRWCLSQKDARVFLARSPDLAFVAGYYAEQWFTLPYGLGFHDPVVAVAIFHPEVLTTVDSAVRVDLDDMGKTTRVAPGGDSTWIWKTSTSVDFAKFREAFFGVLSK